MNQVLRQLKIVIEFPLKNIPVCHHRCTRPSNRNANNHLDIVDTCNYRLAIQYRSLRILVASDLAHNSRYCIGMCMKCVYVDAYRCRLPYHLALIVNKMLFPYHSCEKRETRFHSQMVLQNKSSRLIFISIYLCFFPNICSKASLHGLSSAAMNVLATVL